MKLNTKNIASLLIFIFIQMDLVYGQQPDTEKEGEVEDAEIVITKDRQLTLPKLEKIFEKKRGTIEQIAPEIRPNIFKQYNYLPQKSLPRFEAKLPIIEAIEQPYENYIKAGLGNFQSILLQSQINIPTKDNKIIGLNIDHLSFGKGAVKDSDSKSSNSGVGIYSKFNGQKSTFSAQLKFNSLKEKFYGHSTLPLNVDFDLESQNFSVFQLMTVLEDVNSNDKWNYNVAFNYHNVTDNFNASEFQIGINTKLIFEDKVSLDIDTRTSKYQDITDRNRSYFRVVPSYLININSVQVKAGLSFNFHNDSTTTINRSKIFPFLEASYPLSAKLEFYGKIDAGFDFRNYKDIISENPFVNSQLAVQAEEKSIDFKIGMNSQPVENLSIGTFLNFSSVENKSVFVNSGLYNSKFDLVYLSEPTNILSFELNSKYQINDNHELGINFKNINYSNDLTSSFHLPNMILDVNGRHKIGHKFLLNWNYNTLGGIKAFNNDTGESDSFSVQNLSLSGNYHLKERLNLFVNLDNIFNQANSRFFQYELRGFQVKTGIFYKF